MPLYKRLRLIYCQLQEILNNYLPYTSIMKKKLLIGTGILLFLLVVGFFYVNYRNRTLSPPGSATYEQNGLKIDISYSRPSKRDRLIFGEQSDGALVPYGVYWRLGANEATEITFNQDVLFNGEAVEEGTYRMYAVPGKDEFEIALNSETGKWGYSEPDYDLDVLKTTVPVITSNNSVEQFTIRFEERGDAVLIICEWSDTRIEIPVQSQ